MGTRRMNSTVTVPKWIGEIAPQPKRAIVHWLKTITFLKLKEYERQISVFRGRHHMLFDKFEKKIRSLKKENTKLWDDYIIWTGLEEAYRRWEKRYNEL